MRINLRFKIYKDEKKDHSWLDRFCARWVARMIHRSQIDYYQFGGWVGAGSKAKYELIDADKYQLMHWILREVGYRCCPADVMERCGVDPEARDCGEACN